MALLKSGTRIYGNATIDTQLAIDGNTSATSSSTGALVVAGGVGIAGNIYSAGSLVTSNANLGNAAYANYFVGDGSLLTNIPAGAISGSYSNSNVENYLPTYTGNFSAGNVEISGNLTVNGSLEYTNVNNLYIKDSIIEQGGGSNGAALTSDDNKDRGSLLHYYDGSTIDAFIGWKNANSEFVVASNVTASNNTVTINELGNLRANIFIGNLSGTANTANTATTAGTVTTNAQPNITSVGTLSNLSVSGNIAVSNGIAANGSYGNLYNVLTSDGNGNTTWKARYFYSTVMYDFTDYGMGYQTIAPNQNPATLGFLANVSIPHGSVWMLVTNDGLADPAPITIYSPNSKATPMMWVTIDGSGPYDPINNPGGGDYWFNITPPA
jgi:hypothetical protein